MKPNGLGFECPVSARDIIMICAKRSPGFVNEWGNSQEVICSREEGHYGEHHFHTMTGRPKCILVWSEK